MNRGNGRRHDIHRTACEDDTDSPLLAAVHLQLAHNEDWDNTERPVGYTTQCRVSIERVDNDFGWNAMSFATTELLPEERDRPALEGEDEEEVYTVHLDGDEAGPEDNAVCRLNSNTQQEDTNAAF
jgi:hypothetical protein